MRRKKFSFFRMHPKYWGIILLLLAALFGAGYASQNRYLADSAAEVARLTAERDQLQEDILDLQRKLDFSKTDAFIEREARSRFHFIKPGEILFLPEK